ncbi:MAG: zinc-dependent metalloprotease family protein [Candidatus Methanomethyliaceae archaeon]
MSVVPEVLDGIKAGTEVELVLAGKSVTAVTQDVKKKQNSITWTGKVKDDDLSILVLTITEGYLSGALHTGTNIFHIRPTQTPGQGILEDVTEAIVPDSPINDVETPLPLQDQFQEFYQDSFNDFPVSSKVQADATGVSYIDVLAIYSTALKNYLGGEGQVKSQITTIVEYANTVMRNSNINVVVRIAGYREVNLPDDTQGYQYMSDMYYEKGLFSNIRQWMDQTGADQATLFTTFSFPRMSYCGLGYQPNARSIYSGPSYSDYRKRIFKTVVAIGSSQYGGATYTCLADTFAHELGHNLGAGHDKAHDTIASEWNYNHGYCGSNYGTIMAYCWPRVPYFSENRTAEGKQIGAADAENAKVIRWTAPYVAVVRNGTAPPPSPSFTATAYAKLSTGQPLSGLLISAYDTSTGLKVATKVTDNAGKAVFNVPAGKTYKLVASSYYTTDRISPTEVTVTPSNPNATFVVTRPYAIKFTRYPSPAKQRTYAVFQWSYVNGPAPFGWTFTVTDLNGRVKYTKNWQSTGFNSGATLYLSINPTTYPVGTYNAKVCINTVSVCDSVSFQVVK